MDTCTNGEVYNLIIRGADRGGLDGVDIWSTNIWVHDVEVTNRDEWLVQRVYLRRCMSAANTSWVVSPSRRVNIIYSKLHACETLVLTGTQSPSNYILVENIFCNLSGGSAIGSLGANTGSHPQRPPISKLGSDSD